MKNGEMLIFSGNSNRPLANDICKNLGINLSSATVNRFSEGETHVKINKDVRGKDVFVVQPTTPPVNEHLMELLIMIDALRRASARRITAVLPYYGYARQDRKDQPRVPITAKLVANLITNAGADRVLTMDLHAGQIQGFFDIPLDNLYAINVFLDYFLEKNIQDRVVVSPDVGGLKMARAYAKRLSAPLAIVDKRRISDKDTEVMHIMGEVEGKNVIIVDDIIATAGSIAEASNVLKRQGAKDVYAAIAHPILSGPAIDRIKNSPIKELVVTDTIPLTADRLIPQIKVLSISNLIGEAIVRIHKERSISSLFDKDFKL